MIQLHRLNKKEFILNCDLIRYVESTPDTLITLGDGNDKIMVLETVDEVVDRVIKFKQLCFQGPIVTKRDK